MNLDASRNKEMRLDVKLAQLKPRSQICQQVNAPSASTVAVRKCGHTKFVAHGNRREPDPTVAKPPSTRARLPR